MKNTKFSNFEVLDDLEKDCQRIVNVFQEKGIYISVHQAKYLWELYSDIVKSQSLWIPLPKSDQKLFSQFDRFVFHS